jgi:dimethylaniline monooxygenase (N-oxide forming)
VPLDLVITRQKNVLKYALDRHFPALSRWLFDYTIEYYSKKSFKLDPSWRLSPAPSLATHQPVISDNLISSLWAGDVTSVHALRRFVNGETVELLDGTKLAVDAVIFCTGYEPDFSIIPGFSPMTSSSTGAPDSNSSCQGPSLARLYQNIFPPKYADSIAYMNHVALTDGAMAVIDLAAMAIAQVWKGNYKLPSESEMNTAIDKHHDWIKNLAKNDSVYCGIVRPGPWLNFMNSAAGTRVDENLGYGWEGWRFWWRDRKLCNLMMRGVMTPYMYRVFDSQGRRPKWDGAREAIFASNEQVKVYR